MSSLVRVRKSGSLFQSNVCNLFFPGINCCPFYRGVRYSEVSARRELTVPTKIMLIALTIVFLFFFVINISGMQVKFALVRCNFF